MDDYMTACPKCEGADPDCPLCHGTGEVSLEDAHVWDEEQEDGD